MNRTSSPLFLALVSLLGFGCGGGSSMSTPPPAKLPAPVWDWAGVIGTGQSLSVAYLGTPINLFTQPYNNLKLSLGTLTVPPYDPTNAALKMIALTEPLRNFGTTYPEAYPGNILGETYHTAMADQITALYLAAGGTDYITAHTEVGESGQPMTQIEKGAVDMTTGTMSMGRAYAASLFEAQAITSLAAAAGQTYGVGAIVLTHGEADAGNSDYESEMFQMWTDYNTDLPAITGQTAPIAMLVSQQESTPTGLGSTSASTLAEWQVGVDHPGQVICVGPKYQYPYGVVTDTTGTNDDATHLNTTGYEQLGEKYAQVYFNAVVLGKDWQPLQPIAADASGNVINVHFNVPVAPLQWDDTLPPPQQEVAAWMNGRGFEVTISGAPETIQSVAITGDKMDTVQITCADAIPAGNVSVGYAFSAVSSMLVETDPTGAETRHGTVRWGQLRDSDPFVGSTTNLPQPNYSVSFYIPVPYTAPVN
jgi:hypothetical protein